MALEKIVKPKQVEGWNIPIWNNIFGIKLDYDCGECGYSQSVRVKLRDYPTVACSHCNTLNKFPLVTEPIGEYNGR